MRMGASRLGMLGIALVAASCGAKTGLLIPDAELPEDAGMDAPMDSGIDSGICMP